MSAFRRGGGDPTFQSDRGDGWWLGLPTSSYERALREIEAGVFQRVPMGRSSIEISLSAYRRELEDEIDFDLATFRYGKYLQDLCGKFSWAGPLA